MLIGKIHSVRLVIFFAAFLQILFLSICAEAKETVETPEKIVKTPPDDIFYEVLAFERVVDGDTFKASGRTIRIWGINAPEKKQPLYEETTLALKAFLETGVLKCKLIEQDKYKRDVMHCYSGQNDLGALMVKAGFARDFAKYSGGFYRSEQNFAKSSNLGIWVNPYDLAPK